MVNGGRNEVSSASVFDWRTNTWTRVQNMTGGRWYNTTVAFGQGNVFTATGSGTGNRTAERWNASTGWTNLTGIPWGSAVLDVEAGYARHWHPFLSLAPDGRVLHFGPTDTMHWLTMAGTGTITNSGGTVPGAHYPKEGSFAMYDEGKILVAGGGANTTQNPSDSTTGTSTKLAYTVDMTTTPPTIASHGIHGERAPVCQCGGDSIGRGDGHRWQYQWIKVQRHGFGNALRNLEPQKSDLAHSGQHQRAAQLSQHGPTTA